VQTYLDLFDDKGDLDAAIAKCQEAWGTVPTTPTEAFCRSILATFEWMGTVAVVSTAVGVIVGLGVSMSLSYSNCREDPAIFARWFAIMKYMIFFAYALFAMGIACYFFAVVVALELKSGKTYGRPLWWGMVIFGVTAGLSLVYIAYAHKNSTNTLPTKTTKVTDASEMSDDAAASRSIAELVAAACEGASGIPESQREFAAKMISGMGFETEKDFAREFRFVDWARHMAGFPARVECCLKMHFEGAGVA